jgi:hypothetical protein
MNKIKAFLTEYWVLISWLITVLLDTQYNFIELLIANPNLVNFIRIAGSALLAYMTENGLKSKQLNIQDIGSKK